MDKSEVKVGRSGERERGVGRGRSGEREEW